MVSLNPGTDPVQDATEAQAAENIIHLIADCNVRDVKWARLRHPEDYGEGRFAFILYKGTRCHVVQMPGLSLNRVRFMSDKDGNPFDFPRLYVDDSSWLWQFALDLLGEAAFSEENLDF